MAMVSLIGMIVVLVLILAVFGCIFYAVHRIKEFSRQTLGTDDLKEGFRQVEEEYAKTPIRIGNDQSVPSEDQEGFPGISI